MKKDTNWVTIPDDALHTPASSSKKGSKKAIQEVDANHMKSNIFFGAAFVVLVLVTFALLAPSQFSGLLKGSLFDASDVAKDNLKINLLPKQTSTSSSGSSTSSSGSGSSSAPSTSTGTSSAPATTGATTSSSSTSTGSGGTSSAPATTSSGTGATTSSSSTSTSSGGTSTTTSASAVKAESKAVSISIAPVSTTKDCTTDMTCFLPYLKDCKLAKGTYSYKIDSKDFETSLEITGSESTNCLVTTKVTKSPDTSITSTDAKCKIPQGTYTKTALDTFSASTTNLSKQLSGTYCTGTAVTNMKKYLDEVEKATATKVAADKASSEAKAVSDLKAELEKLQKKQVEDAKKIQSLTTAATHPAASTSTTTTQVPTSVTSTATIGQPTAVAPAFKANPYKVTSTPQQMLQKNLASGMQYATQGTSAVTTSGNTSTATSGNTVTYYQPYSVSVVKANVAKNVSANKSLSSVKKTPSSGPTEMLLITFVITFLGLIGWKFRKIFV